MSVCLAQPSKMMPKIGTRIACRDEKGVFLMHPDGRKQYAKTYKTMSGTLIADNIKGRTGPHRP
jgi:hypothetical protein